jgi:hypothetical protein
MTFSQAGINKGPSGCHQAMADEALGIAAVEGALGSVVLASFDRFSPWRLDGVLQVRPDTRPARSPSSRQSSIITTTYRVSIELPQCLESPQRCRGCLT